MSVLNPLRGLTVAAILTCATAAQADNILPGSPIPPPPGTGYAPPGSPGGVPLAGTGYLGPAKQALIGAGMSVPSQDKAFFGTNRTTCPPRGQSNDFSRNNPGVCDNY